MCKPASFLSRHKKIIITLCCLQVLLVQAYAQNTLPAIGDWQYHFSYQNARHVVQGDKIYCATANNLFSVDSTNDVEIYSKLNGLSQIGVSCIGWDATTQQLVVAYNNSVLDILRHNNNTQTISAIQRSTIAGNKTIYHIFCNNGLAYLSTGLGVVVVDLVKYEVKDTWIIGNNGIKVKINGCASDNAFFYAATDEGLKQISLTTPNKSDYANWTNLNNDTVTSVALFNQQMVATKQDSVLLKTNNGLVLLYTNSAYTLNNLTVSNNQLLLCQQRKNSSEGRVVQLNNSGAIEKTIATYSGFYPQQAIATSQAVWVATTQQGLLQVTASGTVTYVPNGPSGAANGAMVFGNNTLYAADGAIDQNGQSANDAAAIYQYNNHTWSNTINSAYFNQVSNIVALATDPATQSVWAGSFGNGLLNTLPNNTMRLYNAANSSLQNAANSPNRCQVSGLAFDGNGNLWMSNYGAAQDISVKQPDGTFTAFTIPFVHANHAVGSMAVDAANQIWITDLQGNGIFCYNYGNSVTATNDDRWKQFTQGIGNGNLPSNTVLCVTKDNNGFIWIGTNNGIGVVQCPTEVFTQNCETVLPVVHNDQFAGYLFQGVVVNAIAVDGANRKWVGTPNGVWLLSADGRQVVYHFTAENSLLPGNNIQQIAINPANGEVFFATNNGICSYRSTATQGGETNSKVLVFPNPVPPNYTGTVAINGLVNNALVKIAELNGRLVYQTRALGGQAIWNGRNYKGEKISSGVYLVLVTDDAGNETIATKIAVVR